MRRTYRYDADLDAMVEVTRGTNHPDDETSRLQIIRDIEPYRAIASDIASDNKRPVIGSRGEHRAFLRRNNYIETGNEVPVNGRPDVPRSAVEDIRRAMGDYGSNTGARR